ncbi:MAG: TonB-dependent receptor [Bryobacteraceae bacterium]|nr:TonB-dependent receptor [Bryobacteraceae bacterium]
MIVLLSCAALSQAQSTAILSGRVLDPSGAAIPDATITVLHRVGNLARSAASQHDGAFTLMNLPLQTYELRAAKTGFAPLHRVITLNSNVPVSITLTLELEQTAAQMSITAMDRAPLVDPAETGTRVQMSQTDIERMSTRSGNRGLESVLLTFPGFAQNANGAIHPRGVHNQMTFVVDGMPINDQLTGAFANAVDPEIVQTVELYTGNIPAEYGAKVAAVANVTTRSGMGSGRAFSGSASVNASQFDSLASALQVAGERGRIGYSGSVYGMKSNRYLDQVTLDNLHNGGNLERAFGRLDWHPSDRNLLRFNAMTGRSSFQLANLRSQHANGMDQRQRLTDFSAMAGWIRTINPSTTYDATASIRTSAAHLLPSAGDTPVTAWQNRRLTTLTFWNRVNHVRGGHTLKAGFDAQYFPVREAFDFGVTDPEFGDEILRPYDLSRGGSLFRFRQSRAGQFYSGFLQDNVRWGRLQLTLGLRYDVYRFLVNGNHLQPRLGLSYHLRETNTVLRASYNRTYQTPPNENLLLSSSDESSALVAPNVRATLGGAVVQIQPERQNIYEVGVQQGIGSRMSVNVAYYHKNSRDQQDNNNFFDTGIIFPMALARIRVNGVEGRLVVPEFRGFSGTLSLTHARAISTPPFTGGLFIGNTAVDILNAGPFFIDHDQKLSAQGVIRYASRKGFYATTSIRHDSGLVTNPSDPAEVAADADYADLLPYVNLTSAPPRTRPRTVTDLVIGYERRDDNMRRWDVALQVANVTNRTALYNFQSLFVGTRLIQPRTAGVRLRWFF